MALNPEAAFMQAFKGSIQADHEVLVVIIAVDADNRVP